MTAVPLTTVLAPFAEVFTAALHGAACFVHDPDVAEGRDRANDLEYLPTERWRSNADPGDQAVLAHCRGRTLDIGCGPGRMSAHLAGKGRTVAGIDIVPAAVQQTRSRGVTAWLADVFEPVPLEGAWETALLADGNIGIGGDPVRLLRRVRALLAPGGRVVADLAPHGSGLRSVSLMIRTDLQHCRPFPWAVVGADMIGSVAAAAALAVLEVHEHAGRWFAVLEMTP